MLLPLLAVGFLLLAALAMTVIGLLRPRFAYQWLIAIGGALAAWLLVLFARPASPAATGGGGLLPVVDWSVGQIFVESPAMLCDGVAWVYAMALVTLALVTILTAVARPQPDWRPWSSTLTLVGLGLLAVWAGNALTLMLSWILLDVGEFLVLLVQGRHSAQRELAVVTFGGRLLGVLILLWGDLAVRAMGGELTFADIPAQASVYLLVAAGLRLGVLPLQVPFLGELPLRRGLGTALRLVPAAASLTLLARTAINGAPANLTQILLPLTALAAVVGGGLWLTATSELSGRPFWVLGLAALAVGAALRQAPLASLAWGLALLLPGALLFLFSARRRGDRRYWPWLAIPVLGWLSLTALPFTPIWAGSLVYGAQFGRPEAGFWPWSTAVLFLGAHALLLAGYMRHALQLGEPLLRLERWVGVVYPVGLALLVMLLVVLGRELPAKELTELSGWWRWVGGGLAAAFGVGIWFLTRRWLREAPSPAEGEAPAQEPAPAWARFVSLRWLYQLGWNIYRLIGRGLEAATLVMEGDGGLLWALLLLLLVVSLVLGWGAGG
jgi:hypothetical protein